MEATGVPADPNEAATAWSAEPGGDETGAAEDIEWRTIDVGAAQHGQRLDRMLADAVAEFSRSYLQQLIEQGAVSLQGKPDPQGRAQGQGRRPAAPGDAPHAGESGLPPGAHATAGGVRG
jgi:cytochrome c1